MFFLRVIGDESPGFWLNSDQVIVEKGWGQRSKGDKEGQGEGCFSVWISGSFVCESSVMGIVWTHAGSQVVKPWGTRAWLI